MASIELRTPKNKPAYYKITASITLNGQTIRKFSRFEFDPKTLKTAKQRVAAATAAAFEFEAKAQEEAERSLSGANKPFQEVAEECAGKACSKESRSQGYSPTHVSPYLCQPAHVES